MCFDQWLAVNNHCRSLHGLTGLISQFLESKFSEMQAMGKDRFFPLGGRFLEGLEWGSLEKNEDD